MKKYSFLVFALGLILFSCGDKNSEESQDSVTVLPTAEEISKEVVNLEDSLIQMSKSNEVYGKQMINLTRQSLIEKLKYGYQNFPEDKKAPEYLAKLHMLYASIGVDDIGNRYADTLLDKYPNFKDKRQIVESQIVYYSQKTPYEPKKVEDLINLVLSDKNSNLTVEQREDYEFRLKHIDLDLNQLIELQTKELKK